MTPSDLLALIDARAAEDAEFAALVAARNDTAIAAALSVGRTRLQSRLITERGVISALGPIEGEALLQGLEGFAAAALPPEHPLAAHHAGIKRVIGWLRPPSEGVDIGDPLTQQLLDFFGRLGPCQLQLVVNEQRWPFLETANRGVCAHWAIHLARPAAQLSATPAPAPCNGSAPPSLRCPARCA